MLVRPAEDRSPARPTRIGPAASKHGLRRVPGKALAGLIALALAAQLAWTLEPFGGEPASWLFTDALYPLVLGLAAGSCFARAARVRRERQAWILLGAGLLVWLAAELVWAVLYEGMAEPPVPSLADGLYLAFYPLAFASILMLARARIGRVHRVLLVDGLLGGLVVATIAAALLHPAVIEGAAGDLSTLLTTSAYPIGDLALVGAILSVAALTSWRPGRAWSVLGAGLLLNAAADAGYIFAVSVGSYSGGTIFDWLYTAAAAVIAAAAWQQPPTRSHPAVGRWHLLAPLGFASVALVVLVVGRFEPVPVAAVVLAALTLLVAVGRATNTYGLLRALAQSRRDALTDPLTGLGNRTLFTDRAAHALAARRRDGGTLALLFLDLDDFKSVNDSLGHPAGDETLRVLAHRLQEACRQDNSVARLGGDEFGVLIDSLESVEDAVAAAERLGAAISEPFALRDHDLLMGVSIGIAMDDGGSGTVDLLLKRADEAMYRAKAEQSLYEVHDGSPGAAGVDRLALASELRVALARGELDLYFQPKVALSDGAVTSVEALVRWRHPERGIVMPGEFLAVAERSGQMKALTSQVLELALWSASHWRASGGELSVAVNVPAALLRDSWLPQRVAALLDQFGLPGSALMVELTEGALVSDYERVETVLHQLSAQGVSASVDDFGTGYSSLARLSRLPIAELKIDRAFVFAMGSSETDLAIVRSTINLGHDLGMRVVAEGIEDAQTYRELRALGCDEAQGFFMGKPMPASELDRWMCAWERERVEVVGAAT
ncbi:MAG: diguanylate cyclase [Thermoleophilaceae bacterium]|jgi:diguanylate cyclase (GGDEF)-like protein|nr:diguanylate cyclase [Thermoleophilaceae bacterium]